MKKIFKRIIRAAIRTIIAFILLSILWVLVYRFVNPPISGMMIYKSLTVDDYSYEYEWVDLSEVSISIPMAFIASEDQLFLEHNGFDISAIQHALKQKQLSKKAKGASTISQQVAKNIFLVPTKSIFRKGLEAYFTVLIELFWSKRRIMEIYINCVELDVGTYGIKTASENIFNKSPLKLSRSDAALIATALPNPNVYSLAKPSSYMFQRRDWVLRQMNNLGGEQLLLEWYE